MTIIYHQPALFPGFCKPSAKDDWNFASENTQYLTHGIHPYLAAMIPQIPRKLLSLYAKSGMRVLDPFVGGGSVLVEAYLSGLSATGVDINPLATLITRAKTTPIPANILNRTHKQLEAALPGVEFELPVFSKTSNVDYWFKPYMFEPLAQLGAAIRVVVEQTIPEYQGAIQNLLTCIYSNTIRDVSLTYRGEIRLRRLQQDKLESFNPNILEEFRIRLHDSFKRVSQLPFRRCVPGVITGDTKTLPFKDKEFDIVITSPPYGDIVNTIPYHQFSKNMLYWLGQEQGINDIRNYSLGSRSTSPQLPGSRTLDKSLKLMTKEKLIKDAHHFYSDYAKALSEITRVTNKKIIIVIGHRILNGVVIDNAAITTEIMQHAGWGLEVTYKRNIKKKRLNRVMGYGNNAQGATIDVENILVYSPL